MLLYVLNYSEMNRNIKEISLKRSAYQCLRQTGQRPFKLILNSGSPGSHPTGFSVIHIVDLGHLQLQCVHTFGRPTEMPRYVSTLERVIVTYGKPGGFQIFKRTFN
jgi:hypothetical protein